jgi:hypothetical protein
VSTLVESTDACVESTVTAVESVVVSVEAVLLPQDANKATTPIDKITFFICLFFFWFINYLLSDYKYSLKG